jgi:hypothetical protein
MWLLDFLNDSQNKSKRHLYIIYECNAKSTHPLEHKTKQRMTLNATFITINNTKYSKRSLKRIS